MAQIDYFVLAGGVDYNINLGGSGIGFFGAAGFGASIAVGDYNGATFICDGNGVSNGGTVTNTRYLANAGNQSGVVATTQLNIRSIPNSQATLNIRFSHATPVKTQNVRCRIYDRSDINNGASGVDTRFAEVIHPIPWNTATAVGSGYVTWIQPVGSSVIAPLAPSPGMSGCWAPGSGSTNTSLRHDNYIILSASPNSIGSKSMYSLYTQLEYL
jgi:hypothetical protein